METLLGRCGAEHPKSAYSQQCLPSITAMIQPFSRGRCLNSQTISTRKFHTETTQRPMDVVLKKKANTMETSLGRCGAEHPKTAYSQQCLPSITAVIQFFSRGRCVEFANHFNTKISHCIDATSHGCSNIKESKCHGDVAGKMRGGASQVSLFPAMSPEHNRHDTTIFPGTLLGKYWGQYKKNIQCNAPSINRRFCRGNKHDAKP